MNYLQIVQRLKIEAGVSGTVSTITGLAGELLDLATWSDGAYDDIQGLHETWRFMRGDFAVSLISGTSTYTPAALNLTDLSMWRTEDIWIYDSKSDESPLLYESWEVFRAHRLMGTIESGRPTHCSVKPDNSIIFWPTPDDVYTVSGEYWKTHSSMSSNTDTPNFPAKFHMLVVWRALLLYGANLAAEEKYNHAAKEHKRLLRAMESQELPKMEFGEPLA